ncbi:MAG: DUF503 domain-containing protein [Cellulosilyticaceae bacterium]
MVVGIAELKFSAPWVHSLKEKRMVVRSILGKASSKFNVAIAEVDAQDIHQTIVIGLSVVSNTDKLADAMMDEIIQFIEANTEAELLDISRELV